MHTCPQTAEGREIVADGFAEVAATVLESYGRGDMPHIVEGVNTADTVLYTVFIYINIS